MNLQENIQRIKSMMNLNESLSDIQGTPLYHKTSTNRGLDIINSDSLRGSLPSEEYLVWDDELRNTKKQRAISFTRDKNWEPDQSIGMGLDSPIEDKDITFVVDSNKLKTKYKLVPFDYATIGDRQLKLRGEQLPKEYIRQKKNPEMEERVLTDEIYPLRKYLIDIEYAGDNPDVRNIIDNYLSK